MELFLKKVDGFQSIAIFAKKFNLDVQLGSKYTSVTSLVLVFFRGLHITSKIYYNLSVKEENYHLD